MSDADNQTGGSGDPQFEKQPGDEKPKKSGEPETDSGNDNDVVTEDYLPSGG